MAGAEPRKPGVREGFLAALQAIAVTLLAIGQTRLELLGNEIEAEKLRAVRMLLLAQAITFCAALGVLLLVALVALVMWEQRLGVVAAFAVLFLVAAAHFYRVLMRMVNFAQPAFAATLAELKEDMRQLNAASSHARTPD